MVLQKWLTASTALMAKNSLGDNSMRVLCHDMCNARLKSSMRCAVVLVPYLIRTAWAWPASCYKGVKPLRGS